jgi:hypothetical protein
LRPWREKRSRHRCLVDVTDRVFLPALRSGFSLLSIVGLYALLTRTKASDNPDTNAKTTVDHLTSQTGTGFALVVTGLLILVSVLSRPAAWWGDSILEGTLSTGVYWLGTVTALAGAVTVTVAATDRMAFAGIALTGAGGALLFGLAGDLVAGVALIGAAAAGGWATRSVPPDRDDDPPGFPEPLLLTISIVALFVLTASTLHRSSTSESPLAGAYEAGSRSLPRPSVARRQSAPTQAGETQADQEATREADSPWHSVGMYGLLIVVAAVGIWQQFSNDSSRASTADSSENANAIPLLTDNTTTSPTAAHPRATGDQT